MVIFTFTFIHVADTFIQSDLQIRTIEAVKVGQQYDPSKFNLKG